jgi:hypothetical protein
MKPGRSALGLALACALGACGGDGGPQGSAPVISALTYAPATATVGQQVTVTGQFAFSDTEADVARGSVEIRGPAGQPAGGSTFNVPGAGGRTGAVSFAFAFTPASAGRYEFDLSLLDAKNNRSNKLSGAVEAQ